MTEEIVLGIFATTIIGLIITIYYLGKRNGKLEEQNANCQKLLEGQAYSMRTLEAQLERAGQRMDKINANIDAKNADPNLTDTDAKLLWEDPTNDLSTNSPTVESTTGSSGSQEPKK